MISHDAKKWSFGLYFVFGLHLVLVYGYRHNIYGDNPFQMTYLYVTKSCMLLSLCILLRLSSELFDSGTFGWVQGCSQKLVASRVVFSRFPWRRCLWGCEINF